MKTLPDVLAKAADGERISREEGLLLLDHAELLDLADAANTVRFRMNPKPDVTFVIDTNPELLERLHDRLHLLRVLPASRRGRGVHPLRRSHDREVQRSGCKRRDHRPSAGRRPSFASVRLLSRAGRTNGEGSAADLSAFLFHIGDSRDGEDLRAARARCAAATVGCRTSLDPRRRGGDSVRPREEEDQSSRKGHRRTGSTSCARRTSSGTRAPRR